MENENWFELGVKDKVHRYITSPLPTCLIELEAGTLRVTKVANSDNNFNIVYSYLGRTIEINHLNYLEAIKWCHLVERVIDIVLNI